MDDYGKPAEIYSKVLRAGRRTYFFDVRATKGNDYYLTITESKKFTNDDGSVHYKKHKLYLYKEDFDGFVESLEEVTNFIEDRRKADQNGHSPNESTTVEQSEEMVSQDSENSSPFTDVDFDDI
jgi:hypothetical protein